MESEPDYRQYPWRVGNKVGRTIYAIVEGTDSDADLLIGVMDTRMLASAAVEAHNTVLASIPPGDKPRAALQRAILVTNGWERVAHGIYTWYVHPTLATGPVTLAQAWELHCLGGARMQPEYHPTPASD